MTLAPLCRLTRKLGSRDVGLKRGSHLFETGERELVRTAQRPHVQVPVDATISKPTTGCSLFVTVGAQPPLLPQEP